MPALASPLRDPARLASVPSVPAAGTPLADAVLAFALACLAVLIGRAARTHALTRRGSDALVAVSSAREQSGTAFDPQVVAALERVVASPAPAPDWVARLAGAAGTPGPRALRRPA